MLPLVTLLPNTLYLQAHGATVAAGPYFKKWGCLHPKPFPVAMFIAGTRNIVPLQLSAFISHLAPFSSSFSCLADSLSAAKTNLSLAVLSLPALVLRMFGIQGIDMVVIMVLTSPTIPACFWQS